MRWANRNVCIAAAVAAVALIALFRLVPAEGKDTGFRAFLWVPAYVLFLAAAVYCGIKLETYLDSKREYSRSNQVYDKVVLWAYGGVVVLAVLASQFAIPEDHQLLGLFACFGLLAAVGLFSGILLWFKGTRGAALTMFVAALPQCVLLGGLLWMRLS